MADDAPEWSPPKQDEATGTALYGDYPLNSRLRAEALSDAGESDDPDGLVTAKQIADARDRLAADRDDAERAEKEATPSMAWTRGALVTHAMTLPGVTIEGDANKAAILAAINAATAASTEG